MHCSGHVSPPLLRFAVHFLRSYTPNRSEHCALAQVVCRVGARPTIPFSTVLSSDVDMRCATGRGAGGTEAGLASNHCFLAEVGADMIRCAPMTDATKVPVDCARGGQDDIIVGGAYLSTWALEPDLALALI